MILERWEQQRKKLNPKKITAALGQIVLEVSKKNKIRLESCNDSYIMI